MNIIAEIKDEMFGASSIPFNNPRVRYGARGIVEREDGYIAIFNKKKNNEYKLPGGKIEEGENPEDAFKREVLEETGCEVENIKLLGMTKEFKSLNNFQQISYVFSSKVTNNIGQLQLTQREKDEESEVIWTDRKEALVKITNCFHDLKELNDEEMYHSKFINYRDKEILKYYIQNCG